MCGIQVLLQVQSPKNKTVMKKILPILILFVFANLAQAQLKGMLKKANDAVSSLKDGELSQEEVGQALKQALDAGVSDAVDFLSKEDGYYKSPYKILLPEEAQTVVSKVSSLPGFNNLEEDLTERMNRAAELAAAKAKPIFLNAIKQLTFRDAMDILMGENNAATQYLERTTYQQLYDEFMPIIQASLDEVNARELWNKSVTAYNKLPFVKKTNPNLDDHVNKMALQGLFSLIAKKEEGIRNDVSLRNTDLLRKVFAKQDK